MIFVQKCTKNYKNVLQKRKEKWDFDVYTLIEK